MTDRRRFGDRERAALYVAADGRCTECGNELAPGWHADHVDPYSAGGPTDVINGQALCPPCNLKKGSGRVAQLRAWQTEALERFLRRSADFLCVATPGAGKTSLALAAAERLLASGEVRKIIVVVPTSHLRGQWAAAAHRDFGIQLDAKFTNPTGKVADDFDGIVVTYQSVAAAALLYRMLATRTPTLVILDEIHHGGDELTWGRSLVEAFGEAKRRLLLSGTPDRTDGNPVPFVRYGEDGKFVADYSYDYGQALADRQGIVRQIAFPAFDGEARWLDASRIESRLLSDVDEDSRAKALSSALLPDGPWMESVLREADKELTRHRELVPDAGGLIVAADQFKAAKYAKMMERICGEPVALAISDVAGSSQVITNYGAGSGRWLVAVRMVSEGIDIPRLVVGVYATNTSTDLFFRQVAGRFVRTRTPDDESCATLFIPSVQPLVSYAADIERTIPKALREAEERAKREAKGDGASQLEIDMVVPLAASEAVHLATILSGESFADAELRRMAEVGLLAGMPPSVTPVQIARLARLLGAGQTVATAHVEIPKRSLGDEKSIVRKDLARRVSYLARLVDRPHSHLHADLNRACGDTIPTASLNSLHKRQAIVEQWIGNQDTFGSSEAVR